MMRMFAHVAIRRGVKNVQSRRCYHGHIPQNDPHSEPPHSPAVCTLSSLGWGNASLRGLASSGASRQEMNNWQMLQ
jgi:hypothetical protein